MKDYYKILMVHPEADGEIIKAAYRRLVQLNHPDVQKGKGAEARMKEINEAYEVLMDPDNRARYDRSLSYGKGSSGSEQAYQEPFQPPIRPSAAPWEYAHPLKVGLITFAAVIVISMLIGSMIDTIRKHRPITEKDIRDAVSYVENGKQKSLERMLIQKPLLLTVKDREGKTLLRYAAEYGKPAIAKLIIDRGTEVDEGTKSAYTPLHAAAHKGYRDIAELLVTAGASVNARTIRGHTPLHLAASQGHKDVVEYLISKGAEVNSPDLKGETPLRLATRNEKKDVVDLLKLYGARE